MQIDGPSLIVMLRSDNSLHVASEAIWIEQALKNFYYDGGLFFRTLSFNEHISIDFFFHDFHFHFRDGHRCTKINHFQPLGGCELLKMTDIITDIKQT